VQVSAIADRFVVFWHGHKAADLSNRGQSERELSEYILLGHAAGDGSGGGGSASGDGSGGGSPGPHRSVDGRP
ncbi:MAG: hypothetical protein ACRD0H_26030, partial [Actinomycetes bacterium]